MAQSISLKLNQIRVDYEYLRSKYGAPVDYSGSGMESEQLLRLLKSPTKQSAFGCYKEMIDSIYELGYEVDDRESKQLPFTEDKRLIEIADRYNLLLPKSP